MIELRALVGYATTLGYGASRAEFVLIPCRLLLQISQNNALDTERRMTRFPMPVRLAAARSTPPFAESLMLSTYIGVILGLLVFHGTTAVVLVYVPSPPNWPILAGSALGLAVIFALMWVRYTSRRRK